MTGGMPRHHGPTMLCMLWGGFCLALVRFGGCTCAFGGLHLCRCYAALVQRRTGYRDGKRGLQAWLSVALYGQVRGAAAARGLTLQEFVTLALRNEVGSGAGVGDRSSVGRVVVADGGGSGVVSPGFGSDVVGVVADCVGGQVGSVGVNGGTVKIIADSFAGSVKPPDWESILAAGRDKKTPTQAVVPDVSDGADSGDDWTMEIA